MICRHCASTIEEKFLFCPWCGEIIDKNTEDTVLIQAKRPRRAPNKDFKQARAIYQVWRDKLYLPKYPNLEEYGVKEVGLKKAHVYNYRVIGEKFVDNNYSLRFIGSGDWSIGQVNELKRLTLNQVNSLIANDTIHTNMACKEIRDVINLHFPSTYPKKSMTRNINNTENSDEEDFLG